MWAYTIAALTMLLWYRYYIPSAPYFAIAMTQGACSDSAASIAVKAGAAPTRLSFVTSCRAHRLAPLLKGERGSAFLAAAASRIGANDAPCVRVRQFPQS